MEPIPLCILILVLLVDEQEHAAMGGAIQTLHGTLNQSCYFRKQQQVLRQLTSIGRFRLKEL
jgi:hypothetical protein